MAMVQCPDCGHSISDAALSCPQCGNPRKTTSVETTKKSVSFLLGVAIFFLPWFFAFFTLSKGYSVFSRVISFGWAFVVLYFASGIVGANIDQELGVNKTEKNHAVRPSVETNPPISISISKLIDDYQSNEVRADNKYKGQIIQTRGIVGEIKKDVLDDLYVTIGRGVYLEVPVLQAFFHESMNSRLAKLEQGERIEVACTIDGLLWNILGRNCRIIDEETPSIPKVVPIERTENSEIRPAPQVKPQQVTDFSPVKETKSSLPAESVQKVPNDLEDKSIFGNALIGEREETGVTNAPVANYVIKPSFDCGKANSNQEKLICANDRLMILDVELSEIYSAARRDSDDRDQLRKDQLAWLKNNRNSCNTVECLEDSMLARIEELSYILEKGM